MQFLRNQLDKVAPLFEKGGPLEKFHPAFEAPDTLLFAPGDVTSTASHVRDRIDQKRFMGMVIVALVPCIVFAQYNIGYQAMYAIAQGAQPLDTWHMWIWQDLLGLGFDHRSIGLCMLFGVLFWLPVLLVTLIVGGHIELGSAVIRGHELNEGFLVTMMLLPLTLPPAIPLWMVGLGIAFGILFGKEVFGGTGMNFLNPALTARAFIFFAYPAYMSGDAPWIAADFIGVDNFTGATFLAQAAVSDTALDPASWLTAFLGRIPGSMGETSALCVLAGAVVLLVTRIGSWRTMAGVVVGTVFTASFLNWAGSSTNPMFEVPFYWHFVIGSWAFATVFMATDPVSSAYTERGKWFYGIGIGVLGILIRVVNPAYPEGMMLAILFMNMFAPLIDHYVLSANIRRRMVRSAV